MMNYLALIETLVRHEVEFIVVGGVAAVLHGAPVVTFDLDVVHRRTPENIERLVEALTELEAVFRHHPARITPKTSHLESPGHQLLSTRHGPIDVLGTIDDGSSYEDLVGQSHFMDISGHQVRVVDLGPLIEIKARAGRDKDLAVLPILRNTAALLAEEE